MDGRYNMDNVAIVMVSLGLSVLALIVSLIVLVGFIWCVVEIRIERKTKYEVIHNTLSDLAPIEEEEEGTQMDTYTKQLMTGEL